MQGSLSGNNFLIIELHTEHPTSTIQTLPWEHRKMKLITQANKEATIIYDNRLLIKSFT